MILQAIGASRTGSVSFPVTYLTSLTKDRDIRSSSKYYLNFYYVLSQKKSFP